MASLRGHLLNAAIRYAGKRRLAAVQLTPANIVASRARMERLGDRAALRPPLTRHVDELGGVFTEWTRVGGPARGVILYCHGGGYIVGSPRAYRGLAGRLAALTQCDVAVIDYRLAPEHVYPAAPDDALAAYRALLARGIDPASIVFAGDSAGGNLALVTLQRARAQGLALPACAVLLSPGVDCTFTSESFVDNQKRDAMLLLANLLVLRGLYVPSPQWYTHPEVSPLFADFRGFPPLFLQAGMSELLRDEATRAAHKAHQAGVDVELELWPETPHVFQLAPFLPEATQALDQIVKFIVARTGWDAVAPPLPPVLGGLRFIAQGIASR